MRRKQREISQSMEMKRKFRLFGSHVAEKCTNILIGSNSLSYENTELLKELLLDRQSQIKGKRY